MNMAELDDLPESVRAAIRTMSGEAGGNRDDAYDVIEAELLRLSRENAELHKAGARGALAQMKVESELAALKARIASAHTATVWDGHMGSGTVKVGAPDSLLGHRVALLDMGKVE
jgi:hypothetical protein